MKYVVVVLALVLSIGCSKDEKGKYPPGSVFGGSGGAAALQFDSSVSSSEQESIRKDLDNISKLKLSNPPSGSTASYFGVGDFSGAALSSWLSERVKYVIGEYYSEYQVSYSSPGSFNLVLGDADISQFQQSSTVMQNTGTGYWLTGKKYSRLYSVPINGQSVEVRGPRVGIIQIGEALFSTSYDKGGKGRDAVVNSLRRISTYFHEARHSDGSGDWAGFPHAKCTEGTFAGDYACEQYVNGPYMLQAALLESFYQSCGESDCDSSDRETLRLLSADKKSRLVSNPTYKDPTPERLQ